jgi:uncharacterized protein YecE (DUF72 family)
MLEPSSVSGGCSGWSYYAWLGHFYPANLERKELLKYYSQVFDFVEIDSSFYGPPNLFMTKRWASITVDEVKKMFVSSQSYINSGHLLYINF